MPILLRKSPGIGLGFYFLVVLVDRIDKEMFLHAMDIPPSGRQYIKLDIPCLTGILKV